MSVRMDPLGFLNAELDALKAQGLYRTLRVLEGEALSHATYDHTSVVNLSSNHYLGTIGNISAPRVFDAPRWTKRRLR